MQDQTVTVIPETEEEAQGAGSGEEIAVVPTVVILDSEEEVDRRHAAWWGHRGFGGDSSGRMSTSGHKNMIAD